jgi:hypothetical protein
MLAHLRRGGGRGAPVVRPLSRPAASPAPIVHARYALDDLDHGVDCEGLAWAMMLARREVGDRARHRRNRARHDRRAFQAGKPFSWNDNSSTGAPFRQSFVKFGTPSRRPHCCGLNFGESPWTVALAALVRLWCGCNTVHNVGAYPSLAHIRPLRISVPCLYPSCTKQHLRLSIGLAHDAVCGVWNLHHLRGI